MNYKCCVEPKCTNTSIKTPEKLFVTVPKNFIIRKKWLQLVGRDHLADSSVVFFCEDHFDMQKDIANYYEYKMGFTQRMKLVDGALPSKLISQQDHTFCDISTSLPTIAKRPRLQVLQECENIPSNATATVQEKEEPVGKGPIVLESLQTWDKNTSTEPAVSAEKSVQFKFKEKVKFRSKAVQIKILTKDACVSPNKYSTTSSCTSPFKIDPCRSIKPSTSGITHKKIGFIKEERSDSDISLYTEGPKQQTSSSYTVTSSSKVSDSGTNISDTNKDIHKMQCLQHTLRLIVRKPIMYIGISKESYYIIHLLHKHTQIPHEHILLCLKKIRLNSTFSELEDNFGLSLSYASKLFLKNVPVIANVLRPFLVNIDNHSIKKTLPVSFRHNYYNVSCIIDCLEIDIQKPTKALFQALTWSEYKKGNTVKYLISCTPNGLVNYISPGFGGRASDVTILQNCNFLDVLGPGNVVLADRGFKHVEQILNAKGIKLLRPPSVASGSKLNKAEVRQTRIIASLRIHIERVIRRIREFHMLKQHSVINKNFLRLLNDIIVIACAFINIQDSLIK